MKTCRKCELDSPESEFRTRRMVCLKCERKRSLSYSRNPEIIAKRHEVERLDPLKWKIRGLKNNAKKRNINWFLSDLEAAWLLMEPCFYCGKEQRPVGSIDRMDSRGEYVFVNCVPACYGCNMSKRAYSPEEFIRRSADINRRWVE